MPFFLLLLMSYPRYSVLYNSNKLDFRLDELESNLMNGIKVFWFGTEDDKEKLNSRFSPFVAAFLLQAFVSNVEEEFTIVDGDISDRVEECAKLSAIPDFNYEQYVVEHCRSSDIIVEAGAGTGKTKVMIDRIMFLLHTADDIDPSEIVMITFTNEAAEQMRNRLQSELLSRYRLTQNRRYLALLEKQSQMVISTIHSFAYRLIRNYGLIVGFTKDVGITSFKHDLDLIILNILNDEFKGKGSVEDELGLPLSDVCSVIRQYWDRMLQIGVNKSIIPNLVWGDAKDERSSVIQNTVVSVLNRIDDCYEQVKRQRNSVSLSDLLADLEEILDSPLLNISDNRYRYLFVDEFQDTDDSQIRVVSKLKIIMNLDLFVVGDIKQSIYRFRGADFTAFETLKELLSAEGFDNPAEFSLRNNYRTVPGILTRLNECFESWDSLHILPFKDVAIPCKSGDGNCSFNVIIESDSMEEFLIKDLRAALDGLGQRIGGSSDPSDLVVVLARTNRELNQIANICLTARIPVIVKQEGSFYKSDAVRDFFAMISSFLFHDPIHLFNFLNSPYSSSEVVPDFDLMCSMNADSGKLSDYLLNLLKQTSWHRFDSDMNYHPAFFVIRSILSEIPVVENYISILKGRCKAQKWSEEDTNAFVSARSKQYVADLDKLMEVLTYRAEASDSLFSIYEFLDLMIRTNRDEESPDIIDELDSKCVHCMTVHKAKGLEFDTVFIPYTNRSALRKTDCEILVDMDSMEVGWKFRKEYTHDTFENRNYYRMRSVENSFTLMEEARILYVAMTRAKTNLVVYVDQQYRKRTWGELLVKGGMV